MTKLNDHKPSTGPRFDCLSVGVTGHRSDQLAGADLPGLRLTLRETLAAVQHETRCQPVLLSSLADGADQLAAEEALALGFALWCPLPFPRDEYALDFTESDSEARFQSLLSRAAKIEELPGSRDSAESDELAYANAGERVLDLADTLIAVWNGEIARGIGGTADIVRSARHRGIPTIWITAMQPHKAIVLEGEPDEESQLRDLVRQAISGSH